MEEESKDKYAENTALILRSQSGDDSATEELVRRNLGLVQSIAYRFIGRGADFEDLVQIGTIGMLKAIRSFDAARGCVFSTYAVPLIFGEIRRFLRDDGPVKVCRAQKKLGAMLMHANEEYVAKTGQTPRIEELAKRCGVDAEEAAAALSAVSPTLSLSEPIFGEEDGATLESVISGQDENEKLIERLSLADALDKLPKLWKQIVLLRYYRDLSQQSTADILGLSQVKISREEKKLIAHLREELSS